MKNKILRFATWAERHWLALIIILSVVMMIFLCAILLSWLAGYWMKALYGMNFDLGSCWQGVSAVAAGLVTVGTTAGAAWCKYSTDSRYNSPLGKPILHKTEEMNDDKTRISK